MKRTLIATLALVLVAVIAGAGEMYRFRPAPPATETVAGILEIATDVEAAAATATNKALVPSNLSSLQVVGTITSGTWQGTPIALDYGGTGATTAAGARTALGLGTMAVQDAASVAITGGTVTVGTLGDGVATMAGGSITGLADLTASGTVTAGTLSDGVVSINAGTVSGLVDLTLAGTLQAGTITATTLTDGTISISGGAVTGLADLTLSGTLTSGTISLVNDINEFSTDGTLAGNSNLACPTEQAVKTYVDAQAAGYWDRTGTLLTPTTSGDAVTIDGLATFSVVPTGQSNTLATLVVDPANASANADLIWAGVNGSEKFAVDAEGDVTVASSLWISTKVKVFNSGNDGYVENASQGHYMKVRAGAGGGAQLRLSGRSLGGGYLLSGASVLNGTSTETSTISGAYPASNSTSTKTGGDLQLVGGVGDGAAGQTGAHGGELHLVGGAAASDLASSNGGNVGIYGGDHGTTGLEGSVYIYQADGATPICRFHETAGVVVSSGGSETWAFDTAGNLLAQGTTLDDSITNGLIIAAGDAPNSSPADACQLWVEDVGGAGQAELRVRDELGNVSNVSANVATYPDSITPSRRYPYVTMCEQRFAGVRTYVALHRLAELVQAWARTRGHLGPGENIIVHERIPREDWTKSEFEKAIQQRMADGVEIPKAQAVEVIEQEDGRQVERVRPGCRHDKRTGKYYRRRTRAEAVEAVQAGDLAPMPDWLRAMREN